MATKRKAARPSNRRSRVADHAAPAPATGRPSSATVALPSVLTIRDAGPVRAALIAALEAGQLEIDGSGVTAVDTAGLQLLVAAMKSAATRSITPCWRGASPVLVDSAQRLGLGQALSLGSAG